jgi:Ca2+-binding RTX toxin-like protein
LGNDTLTGGAGNDVFIFNAALNAATNVDQIMDFDANNNDKIDLENAIFTQLAATGTLNSANLASNAGGNAGDANDYILYDTTTGNLYYDADGNGAGAKILFAHLNISAGTLDASDFLVI